ncbi:MAG: CotH kinase family protein [Clostridia bacterium]|nr:CotH kinase family protein [Clostridia bacterium]
MKKIVSFLLVLALLCTALPMSVLAFDQYTVHLGTNGCRLTSLTFTQANNAWLAWNVTFGKHCDDRVWETEKAHPNMVGRTVIPTFTYEGTSVTFNGVAITSDTSEIELKAQNDLVVYNGTARAEYLISITEADNGLPVVLIDTDGVAIPDKINYVASHITLLDADMFGGEDILAAPAGIKLRGNSTMGYDKKPYRIKFEKKQNVFGLGKAKSWVLLANYLDPAAMRNEIAYKFATRLNTYTAEAMAKGFQVYVPRVRPVEVYLNGEYKGLYDMGDHIQVDSTRIAIDESGDELDENDVQLYPEPDVGYYLEVEDGSRVIPEWYSENAYYVTIKNTGGTGTGTLYTGNMYDGKLETAGTGTLNMLYVQLKTPEIPSQAQVDYIQDYLQTVNDLILAKSSKVWDYIDMDSFIDWYLANELFKNTDSGFLSSVKMHKDKGGKLCMGPVWDFDIGSGAVAYAEINDPTGWRTRTTERCAWYDTLFSMATFSNAVNARWAALHEEGILEAVLTDIDEMKALMNESANDNFHMWHDSYVSAVDATSWLTVPDYCLSSDWESNVAYLRNFMEARIAWMDQQFGYASSPSTLQGSVSILGMLEYNNVLTASTMAVRPFNPSVSYQWYRNGSAISGARSSTYTTTKSDIGASLTVKVTSSSKGSLTSAPVVIDKTTYIYTTSQVPTLVSKTADSITITGRTGYDYYIDGGDWQTDTTFTGLKPNTLYRIYYRHAPTDTQQGGQAGKALYVITDTIDKPQQGDWDNDGTVNMMDALQMYATFAAAEFPEENTSFMDMNGDGIIDMFDCLILYRTVSGV